MSYRFAFPLILVACSSSPDPTPATPANRPPTVEMPAAVEVREGRLVRGEGVVHFAIPAHHWWDNIGFT